MMFTGWPFNQANANTNVSITVQYDAKAFADAGLPVPMININHDRPTDNTSQPVVQEDKQLHTANVYEVKKGDTIFEIMRVTGVYWKDIIKHNNLKPPYNLIPGETIKLPSTEPIPEVSEYTFFGATDFRPKVDRWWSHTEKLSTITKHQKNVFTQIMTVPNGEMQQYLAKSAYIESVYGKYGNGKPRQSAPRGLFQFDKATAVKHGLYVGGTDYRGNVEKQISGALSLQSDADDELTELGIPVVDLWRYLRHQQGVHGAPTLYKVFMGEQKKLKFKAWNGKNVSIRKALLRNLTKDLGKHKSVRDLTDEQLAVYFVQHWHYVMLKANEAVAYMHLQTGV